MSDAVDLDASVVVIGYGPVGATLAGLLARRGVSTIVIDRDTEIYPLPRAAHVDAEVMRIMQEVGCATEMAASMVRNTGMDFLTADHQVLLQMRTGDHSGVGWAPSSFINQPLFEQQLRAAVGANGADVRLGVGVSSLDRSAPDHVTVHLEDGSALTAAFVIGCDGARSTVRKELGTTMHDLEFEEPWLVVDLELDEPVDTLPTWALQVCDPARPHTVVPMPSPRFRFEFMLLPGETAEEMQRPEVVDDLLSAWMPRGAARLERSAVYTFHGLIAHDWRVGRVLLAGDAAHQMPPFLGQGMCSGMRDAANLAWKLAAVVDGAPIDLLDTYQAERDPHVRSIVEAAVGFGRIICTIDPDEAAGRDAMMLAGRSAQGDDATPEGAIPLPPLASTLVADGGGTPSRQPTIDGVLLDDVVGQRWLVVTDTDEGAAAADTTWAALDALVLSCEHHRELTDLLGQDDATGEPNAVAVVRPDRYLYARAGRPGDVVPPAALTATV